MARDLGAGLAGQRADVDLEVDRVGDGVDLRAAVGDGRARTWCGCRRGTGGPCPAGSASQRGAEARRGRAAARPARRGSPCPRGSGARSSWISVRGLVGGDAAHHLGRLHQRVVGPVRLGAVARRARDRRIDPAAALLARRSPAASGPSGLGIGMPPGLGDHVVGPHGVGLVVDEVARRRRCPAPPRRPRRGRSACPWAGSPTRARCLVATAIDAVRLSMSTAPRPHTSPSISSPPKGSWRQPSGFTGTTSVWPISSSVGAVGSVPSMRPTRLVRPGAGS